MQTSEPEPPYRTRDAGYELKDGESFDKCGNVRPVPCDVGMTPEDA